MPPTLTTMRWAIVVVCAVLALWFAQTARDQRAVRDANDIALAGDPAAAAERAAGIDGRPAALRARVTQARALFFTQSYDEAAEAYAAAARLAPNDWSIRSEWAVTELRRGEPGTARRQLARALQLNPRMDVPPELLRPSPQP